MHKLNTKNVKWTLVAEENGKKIVEYPCPNEVVGDIIKILFRVGKVGMCSPTEEIAQALRNILGKPIDERIISQLTGLSEQYLKRFLEGTIEPAETESIIVLTEVITSLSK